MSNEEVFGKVVNVLAQLGVKEEEVKSSSTRDQLGMDSLDDILCIMALEKEFEVDLEDSKLECVENVQDIVDLITASMCNSPQEDKIISELKSTKFKIGDKVKIAKSSEYYGDNDRFNPKDCVGEIIEFEEEMAWKVMWSNGCRNSYEDEDLILVGGAIDDTSVDVRQKWNPTKNKDTLTQNSIDHFKTLTQNNDVTIMFEKGQMKLFWQEFEYIVLDDIELEKVLQAINTLEELCDKMA